MLLVGTLVVVAVVTDAADAAGVTVDADTDAGGSDDLVLEKDVLAPLEELSLVERGCISLLPPIALLLDAVACGVVLLMLTLMLDDLSLLVIELAAVAELVVVRCVIAPFTLLTNLDLGLRAGAASDEEDDDDRAVCDPLATLTSEVMTSCS